MSYENNFKLKLYQAGWKSTKSRFCEKCNLHFEKGNFCLECGNPLIDMTVKDPMNSKELIKELRNESVDAARLLKSGGDTNCSGTGYDIESDIAKFSKKYPETVFQLDVVWDNGFDNPPSRIFFKDGKSQRMEATLQFEDYDEEKLEDV